MFAGTLHAVDAVTRRDAARLQAKLDRLAKNARGARPAEADARTSISEIELNSYLAFEMTDQLPAGVTEPWVSMVGDGRVSGRAMVDLAAIAAKRENDSMLDPFKYLTGRLPLAATGVLRTKNGVGSFALESATISGVPVPQWALQEVVSYYSRSSETPAGVSLERPFTLPVGIQEIVVGRGEAVLVQ